MTIRTAGVPIATGVLALALMTGCTGDSATEASRKAENASRESASQAPVNATAEIAQINPAIPLYTGAQYRQDLSKRDEVMIRNDFGDGAEVYTLATDDSYPQVYHYYTTYLAQFRAFPAQDTYPATRPDPRALEVQLNQAMQDPFIPGKALDPNGKQVTLQIAETEVERKTVIRYIVTDRVPMGPQAPVATAANAASVQTVTR